MDTTARLLDNNDEYAATFAHGHLEAPPRLRLAVITCMDARIDPLAILGLRPGDAHVIRNAGGVMTDDVARSLSISQHALGTEEIIVIQHTECGMLNLDEADFARRLEASGGRRPPWPAGAFSDLETSVRDTVARLREEPFLVHADRVTGFVYAVETGRLRQVV